MEACALNNLDVIIQKTMSPRKSEEDVMIKLVSGLFPLRKIAPPVRVRVWVRVSFRVGGKFSSGAIVQEPIKFCKS